MSLLVVGTVAFDAIETPFGKTERRHRAGGWHPGDGGAVL